MYEAKIAKNQVAMGIGFLLLSGFFFAMMGLFVRLAGDLPVLQKSFFRNAIATLFALMILLKSRDAWHIPAGMGGTLFLRATFGTLGLICNFYALGMLPLSDANMLNKLAPFCTLLFSWLFLKERLHLWQLGLVGVAFLGSLFVIKPSFSHADWGASCIAALGGVFAGAAYTLVRKLQLGGVQGRFIVFFFSAFSSVVLLPFVLVQYQPMTGEQWLLLLATGLMAAGGQFSITAAYRHAPAKQISIYDYMQVFFSMLLGYFAFGSWPDVWSLIGYVILLSAAIVNFFWNRRNSLPIRSNASAQVDTNL